MKLNQIIAGGKPSLSFEVFPPKNTDSYENIRAAAESVAALSPSYISVTYGAGGGTSAYTVSIAAGIQEKYGVPALAHLSCIHSTRESVRRQLDAMKLSDLKPIRTSRNDRAPPVKCPPRY